MMCWPEAVKKIGVLLILLIFSSCAPQPASLRQRAPERLVRLGYALQAGAFAQQENAEGLVARLQQRGVNAFSFWDHRQRLFKVRLGNFASREQARKIAEQLVRDGVLTAYYVVAPQDFRHFDNRQIVRQRIIATARRYLGVPYKWGGTSVDEGFDCSGLAMVCYRLQGLALPRTVRAQFSRGRVIKRTELEPADLVFFAAGKRRRPSHVGIYLGRGRFIHAPRQGAVISIASLDSQYFRSAFLAGRRYF